MPKPIRCLTLGLGLIVLASCAGSTPTAGSSSSQSPIPSASPSAPGSPSPSPTPSPAPSPSASAATAPILADDVCTAIDTATIDSILGLHVGAGVPGPASCSWTSQRPMGTVQLARLTEAQVKQQFPTLEPKVRGIGVRAFGFSMSGLPAPSPRSGASLTVDFGTFGLYENLGGPAVTLNDALKIARLVSTPS